MKSHHLTARSRGWVICRWLWDDKTNLLELLQHRYKLTHFFPTVSPDCRPRENSRPLRKFDFPFLSPSPRHRVECLIHKPSNAVVPQSDPQWSPVRAPRHVSAAETSTTRRSSTIRFFFLSTSTTVAVTTTSWRRDDFSRTSPRLRPSPFPNVCLRAKNQRTS